MRQIAVEKSDLDSCVVRAQQERLIITRKGRPVAIVVGVEGISSEQLQLGTSEKFWKLIEQRRRQGTMSRVALERRIAAGKQQRKKEAVKRPVRTSRNRTGTPVR